MRRALALVVALGSGLATVAGAAPAQARTVTGGTADVAHSRLEVTGGTVTATTAHLTLAGQVVLTDDDAVPGAPAGVPAHGDDDAPDGVPGGADDDGDPSVDVRLDATEVLLGGATGTLLADVLTPAGPDTAAATHAAVEVATIDLTADPLTVSGDVAALDGAPATLTAAGAAAVGGEPGDAIGALSLAVELAPSALHPQDAVVHAGEDAHFTATVAGHPDEAVRWQVHLDLAAQWQDVPDVTGPALVLPAVTVAQDGTRVRAVVGPGTEPDAVSDVATLTVPAPTIEVAAADGVTPLAAVRDGDTVVVTGTGFGPAANIGGTHGPVPGHLPQGVVVALGAFAEHWRPSADAPADSRTSVTEVRALAEDVRALVAAPEQAGAREQWVTLTPDGTFTTELVLTTPAGGWPPDGVLGVYTYAAGGVTNTDQELGVPLELLAPAPVPAPLATVPPSAAAPSGAESPGAVAVPQLGLNLAGDLPERPAAPSPDAPSTPQTAVAAPDEPAAEEPAATTAEGVSTLVMLVVVVLLAGALVAGTRERG